MLFKYAMTILIILNIIIKYNPVWHINITLGHLLRPTRSMMDSSFQLVIGGSSWLVSVVKIQPGLNSEPWHCFAGLFNLYFIAVTFVTVFTVQHDGRTVAVCPCIRLKYTLQSLNIKCLSVWRATGRTAGRLFDSPQRSSRLHKYNPKVLLR